MNKIKRLYERLITDHLLQYRQMVLLPGARQVGKTTLVKGFLKEYQKSLYLNWDNEDHRNMIEHGLTAIVKKLDLEDEAPEK